MSELWEVRMYDLNEIFYFGQFYIVLHFSVVYLAQYWVDLGVFEVSF